MYALQCTKKLLSRIKPPIAPSAPAATTTLGNWHGTALFWKPQLALFVNDRTLLPVFMSLAPATSIATRFPHQLAAVLAAHGVDAPFIAREVAAMAEVGFAKTASRSLVGIMNEFTYLAGAYHDLLESNALIPLSMRTAETPCSPIKYNCPADLLKEVVQHRNA